MIQQSKALIMGVTFKEDVSDIRNSKVIDIVHELKSYQMAVDLVDPHACTEQMQMEYGMSLIPKPAGNYDAIIVAVNHRDYAELSEPYFSSQMTNGYGVFIDVKGIYKGKINRLEYWSL